MLNWKLEDNDLYLIGILDKQTGVELWNNRHNFLTPTTKTLDIRLSELERTDSAGLATLIALYKEAKHKNILMKIHDATQQLLDIARVSGVENILPFV